MKRFVMALALGCALSGSVLAGDMHSGDAPAPKATVTGGIPSGDASAPLAGDIHSGDAQAPQAANPLVTVILTIISIVAK